MRRLAGMQSEAGEIPRSGQCFFFDLLFGAGLGFRLSAVGRLLGTALVRASARLLVDLAVVVLERELAGVVPAALYHESECVPLGVTLPPVLPPATRRCLVSTFPEPRLDLWLDP